MKPSSIKPPTALSRRWVRSILGFMVGVTLGLAPFLGTVEVPLFPALLNVMPFQIRFELVTHSAFLMGVIAMAVQFYSVERLSETLLVKGFTLAFVAMVVGILLFSVLRREFTASVRSGGGTVTVLISDSPTEACNRWCRDPKNSPSACIRKLGLTASAIEDCYGYQALTRRGTFLELAYLILMGGVGGLVGLIILQGEARRQARAKDQTPKRTKKVHSRPRPRLTKRAKSEPRTTPSASDEPVADSGEVTSDRGKNSTSTEEPR